MNRVGQAHRIVLLMVAANSHAVGDLGLVLGNAWEEIGG